MISVVHVYQGQLLASLQGQMMKLDVEKIQLYQRVLVEKVTESNENVQSSVKQELTALKHQIEYRLSTLREHSRLVKDIISQFDDHHRSLARAMKPSNQDDEN